LKNKRICQVDVPFGIYEVGLSRSKRLVSFKYTMECLAEDEPSFLIPSVRSWMMKSVACDQVSEPIKKLLNILKLFPGSL